MTILDAMQSAAIRLVGTKPQVFFASSEQFELEIVDLINEVAKDICKYADWQALTKIRTIAGDDVTEVFELGEDYDRQLVVTDIQDTNSWFWGYQHVENINDFIFYKNRGFNLITPGIWCIFNNELNFWPAPATGATATFPYISTGYARLNGSAVVNPQFENDTDGFEIRGGERLLTLGLIWRWRENKKLDYTGDQEAFMLLIDQLAAKDKGSSVYRNNSRSLTGRLNTRAAWPFELG